MEDAWRNGDEDCTASDAQKWLQGNPGLVLARCLKKHGVAPVDTRVAGRHRFHAFGPVRTATGHVDDWYRRMHEMLPFADPPAHPLPSGEACCDPFSVSFHYVEAAEQVALRDALREDFSAQTNADKDKWLRQHWPKKPKDVGAYEHPVPENDPPARADVRDLITATLAVATAATCPAA